MRQFIRVVYLSAVVSAMGGAVMAQDFEDLISGSTKDANYLMGGYVSPLMKSLGAGLNNGWYNTAKPHKKFGVDLTISVAAIGIPSSEKFFTVDNSKLSSIELTKNHKGVDAINSGEGKVPTIFGPTNTQSEYRYTDVNQPNNLQTFAGIGGVGIGDLPMSRIPVPVVNLGFGLPKNTDIKFRFIPSVGPSDMKFSLFGIGVMHDVKQWIPGIKMLPIDISGFVGYTRMSLKAEIDGPSQEGEFVVSATTIQALVSKKISVLTFYGGTGYNFSKSTLAAKGYYNLNGVSGDGPNSDGNEAKDPVDLSASLSGPRLTMGMRLKLAVITFHGDYTFQKYSAFTAGFGINVR